MNFRVFRLSKKNLISLAVFLVFFLISLVFILVDADRRIERVLFFPDEGGINVSGELRRLPVRDSLEGNVELYIDELILGPNNIDRYRLFPVGVKLDSLIIDKDTLYAGFTENLITTAETVPMSFQGITDTVKKAVVFNFPELKEVKIAVGGEPIE